MQILNSIKPFENSGAKPNRLNKFITTGFGSHFEVSDVAKYYRRCQERDTLIKLWTANDQETIQQSGKEYIYTKELAQTESQENSPFPADGSRVILNKSKNDNK